jgi:hypothetical protein
MLPLLLLLLLRLAVCCKSSTLNDFCILHESECRSQLAHASLQQHLPQQQQQQQQQAW